MLGRFLELSIVTADIRASLEFYARLGFSEAEVGEAWNHPYAVVSDGRICVGLHQQLEFAPSATFVKPDLLQHLTALERLAPAFELRRLGNDVFNEIGWLDPAGHLIRLVEARTFSPAERRAGDASVCGYFVEIALPAPDISASKLHWEQFGFVGIEEPDAPLPHVSCTSDTVDIGLYEPAHFQTPALLFEVDDFAGTLVKLAAAGVTPQGRLPAPLRQRRAVMLTAPEGTSLILSAAADDSGD